jgi:hypothetical protein
MDKCLNLIRVRLIISCRSDSLHLILHERAGLSSYHETETWDSVCLLVGRVTKIYALCNVHVNSQFED